MDIKEIPVFKWSYKDSVMALNFNVGKKFEFECKVEPENEGLRSKVTITMWSSGDLVKISNYLNRKEIPCEYTNNDEYYGEIIYLQLTQNSMRDGKIFVEDWLINTLNALRIE